MNILVCMFCCTYVFLGVVYQGMKLKDHSIYTQVNLGRYNPTTVVPIYTPTSLCMRIVVLLHDSPTFDIFCNFHLYHSDCLICISLITIWIFSFVNYLCKVLIIFYIGLSPFFGVYLKVFFIFWDCTVYFSFVSGLVLILR